MGNKQAAVDIATVEELAAETHVVAFDTFSIVTIPNIQSLSETKRNAVDDRAQQMQSQRALAVHLEAMTPPVDEKEAMEEDERNDIQARMELEHDGCPPCYPLIM